MHVRTATLAGGHGNADRVFVTDHAVIVLDGASAFEPVDVEPGTYADALGAHIADQLDDTATDLADAVAAAIAQTAAKLNLTAAVSPSSTIAILRAGADNVELYVLGDSPIHYGTSSTTAVLTDNRMAGLPLPEYAQYTRALRAGTGYDATHRATLAALQRGQRAHRNTTGGYWIAETDPAAAHHAIRRVFPAGQITWAVLATDGAADLIDHQRQPAWPDIAQYDTAALTALLRRAHEWEEHHDPHGQRLPRAKRHDDKTLAAVPTIP